MGYSARAFCLNCGNTFTVNSGGGFHFHLLRCDQCGREKPVSFEELGELHLRYIKGLNAPYSSATWEQDRYVQKHSTLEPISESEYQRGIEAFAGRCACGGWYSFNALPRCPACHSARIEEQGIKTLYD